MSSMNAALAMGADKYAVVELEAAKKIWDRAESQMQEKNYNEAQQSYVEAKAAMDKVAAVAQANINAAIAAVTTDVVALEKAWRDLQVAANNVKNKLKSQKTDWATDSMAFTAGLKTAKDKIASDPAGAKAKAGELRSIIEKWDATFKKMAATSTKPKATKKKIKHKRKKNKHKKKTRQVKKKRIE